MAALGIGARSGARTDHARRFGVHESLVRNRNSNTLVPDRSRKPCMSILASTAVNFPTGNEISDNPNKIELPSDGDGGGSNGGRWNGGGGGGSGGGGNGWSGGSSQDGESSSPFIFGIWEAFIRGWKARVRTDPQFPFKVLTEEIIGVGACVLGDMATRPNFGLNELDFVFSTVVVGSILNFVLMFMLAPTSASLDVVRLPGIFASCPPGHMFEPGAYTVFDRFGTFVYKGALFAAAGFVAGLVGTAMSTMLLNARKKVDPNFTMQNKPPPTLLNAGTWALHMGLSSNLRYQGINGIEYLLAKGLHPTVFKAFVFGIRAANNVLGGTSFVLLARLTGSQRSQPKQQAASSEVQPLVQN